MKPNFSTAIATAKRVSLRVLADVIGYAGEALLTFDINVIKRYLNIETPLYKMWWRDHARYMQRKMRRNFEHRCYLAQKCPYSPLSPVNPCL